MTRVVILAVLLSVDALAPVVSAYQQRAGRSVQQVAPKVVEVEKLMDHRFVGANWEFPAALQGIMPLTAGQSILCRASRGVFVLALLAMPQASSNAAVRRATELLFADAAKLAGKAKLEGSDFATLPELLEHLSNKYEDTGIFDTNLATEAELMFDTLNAQLGWGLPNFTGGSPQLPPSGGSGIGI